MKFITMVLSLHSRKKKENERKKVNCSAEAAYNSHD